MAENPRHAEGMSSGESDLPMGVKNQKSISLLPPTNSSPGSLFQGNNRKCGQRLMHKHVACCVICDCNIGIAWGQH